MKIDKVFKNGFKLLLNHHFEVYLWTHDKPEVTITTGSLNVSEDYSIFSSISKTYTSFQPSEKPEKV